MSIIAFRHPDVRLRRRRIARGVIVHEHTQNEISLEGPLDDEVPAIPTKVRTSPITLDHLKTILDVKSHPSATPFRIQE